MEGCQLQSEGSCKMVRRDAETADRISNLPVQVLDLILSFLPIRDTVRTSILSKSWRHKWTKVPVLAFNAYCSPLSRNGTGVIKNKALVSIIDHVLLHHTGALEVFKLENLRPLTDIDRWILNVSRKSVREFVLFLRGSLKYELPSSLYDCSSLIKLTLAKCFLKPPSSSVRLQSLKYLDLFDVVFTKDGFANFISSCPSLENLTLLNYKLFANLHIKRAPNLQSVDISGRLEKIIFGCPMVKLSELSINYDPGPCLENDDPEIYSLGPSRFGESELSEFFINLPGIRRLKIASYFVKHLARGSIPVTVSMPFQLKNLYHLAISIDVRDTEYCLAALYIMSGSPNLTEPRIASKAWYTCLALATKPDKWRYGCECCRKFEKLRSVEIVGVNGWRPELKVIEFLLGNSPVLEKMTVTPCQLPEMGSSDFLVALSSFKRASSNAEIIFDPQWAMTRGWY